MLDKNAFLKKFHLTDDDLENYNIEWNVLLSIYRDFESIKNQLETQASFIANTLRAQRKVHTVKSRVKNSEHLIAKLIRKTPQRQENKGKDFQFTLENYREEITDLIGVRVIHIFKEDWEEIHNFIKNNWETTEVNANVRDGDDTERFKELGVDINSRDTGYRSVHYLIQFSPTIQKVTAEIQVRTIFEEGYGEIDHQLRYPHGNVPDVLSLNLLMLNRVAGSSDEMASFINHLKNSWGEMESKLMNLNNEIEERNKKIQELEQKIEKTELDEKEKQALTLDVKNIGQINQIRFNIEEMYKGLEIKPNYEYDNIIINSKASYLDTPLYAGTIKAGDFIISGEKQSSIKSSEDKEK
jgi:ppGpp synthetase/RelA/SpoT-type nucleotidyltranferase